jgi:outer membrane protein assembly factor BamB
MKCARANLMLCSLLLLAMWIAGPVQGQVNDIEEYFDGRLQGNANEAAVRRACPGYYHFTLTGLSKFASLERMRIATIPHESHTSRRLNMRVWTSLPTPEVEAMPGYDFRARKETGLAYSYYDAEGELIEKGVLERDINSTGWVDVPLDHLEMDDVRTFRMSFDAGFRGGINIPYIEVTGRLKDGKEAVMIVRYDFTTEGSRATANTVHADVKASIMMPQGFPIPEPIVSIERPKGAYSAVVLQFAIPDGPESFREWRVYGGLRDNRMQVDHWTRVTQPGGELVREGNALTGSFERQHRGENPYEVRVEARIDEKGNITGSVTLRDNNPWTGSGDSWAGTITGRITPEAELRAANAISTEHAWPRFTGPTNGGNAAQVRGLRTIDQVEGIRLQWACEATDIGQGIGSLNRFAFRYTSARKRSGGGSASPVVADGRVYLYYSRPSPRTYNYFYRAQNFTSGHASFENLVDRMAEQGESRGVFSGGAEKLPVAVLEKIWEAADDMVICMDATTGQTLWQARIENVGYNRQHHKEGPYNQTMTVHDGRVFAIGSGGRLHAMDAKTGEFLWSQRVGGEHTHQKSAVLALPGVVVIQRFERWAGFDPASGKKLWENSDINLNDLSIPAHWRSAAGKDYLFVFADMSTIAMLNASDGIQVSTFSLPVPDGLEQTRFPGASRNGNPGNMTVIGDTLLTHEHYFRGRDLARNGIAAYAITSTGLTPRWRHTFGGRIRGEYSPVVVRGTHAVVCPDGRGLITIDIATGQVTDESDASVEGLPHSNGLLMAMEDLIIAQDDMTHGNTRLYLYKVAANGKITPINPDHPLPLPVQGTGSYHHPMMQPVVDGRLFLRLRDGIYAFDLRTVDGGR